jgi:type III restriction enzyme
MSQLHEVQQPIINSPYREPSCHYEITPGELAKLVEGRRSAMYYYRPPERQTGKYMADDPGTAIPLDMVNEIRSRLSEWTKSGYPGVTRTTEELLKYWHKPEREGSRKLFFCQLEAAETIIFLKEARQDVLQGLNIPLDDPGEEGRKRGYTAFQRYACKMATGTGKTTVMAMLAAWSILNKVNNRQDARFSDVVLFICPNITIRDRLAELDPHLGEQSLYRTRDIVDSHLMERLHQGKVLITNWHVLEPREMNSVGRDSARVVQRGVPKNILVTKTVEGHKQKDVETHYFESDTAFMRRVLGLQISNKRNFLIFNDEAHHAYRLKPENGESGKQLSMMEEESEDLTDYEKKEATVWIDGLDKINKQCGINFCIDLTATPYYIHRTGNEAGRPFPWVVSDFGLVDAIESGIVKIPQLPVSDATGKEIPAYFHVWKWIVENKLTPAEKGGKRGQISPKAVLKYAQMPINQLAGLWLDTFKEWSQEPLVHPTPPVFVVVCRDTKLAKEMYNWIAEGQSETSPPIQEFLNREEKENTIRIDSKVVEEIASGEIEQTKNLEEKRLRFALITIGKTSWPNNKPPQEWIELADKLKVDPMTPPGRDVRCIISVSMLTEGWDATTVTHIIGLRPFTSQLLCEQVVGRGLRRSRYDVLNVDDVRQIPEECAKVYGVPFEVIPFKANPKGGSTPPPKIHHVHFLPQRDSYRIVFPRVEGYSFVLSGKIDIDWQRVPSLVIDPTKIPDEVITKGLSWTQDGRPTLYGPGKTEHDTLRQWRKTHRRQELEYDLASVVAGKFVGSNRSTVPLHKLFPQVLGAVKKLTSEKVELKGNSDMRDIFANPYFGWAVQSIIDAIQPAQSPGQEPEVPTYEKNRPPGSTGEVDFWTAREVKEISKSHVNYVVADTKKWEQSAAYYLDTSPLVYAFVKNEGLGFAIKYQMEGEPHEYMPDYLVLIQKDRKQLGTLILETKGFDPKEDYKQKAAERWVRAVNHDGKYGHWAYRVLHDPAQVPFFLEGAAKELNEVGG